MGAKTVRTVEENIENLHDLGLGKELLGMAPKRKKLVMWALLKFKTFALDNISKKVTKQAKDWEKYLQIMELIKDLYSECIKNSYKSISRQLIIKAVKTHQGS